MSKVSLALGGGGVKGIAHIGVLRRLEKEGYSIQAIAGTSAGGMVGAIFACGYTIQQIEELFSRMDQDGLYTRDQKDGPALMGLHGLSQALEEVLGDKTFEDLLIPFACTAVNLRTGQEVILNKGRVLDAVLATIAIPGIFPPVVMGDMLLVDGGVLDPVPVTLARWLAPGLPVVAVCLSPAPETWAEIPPPKIPFPPRIPETLIGYFYKLRVGQALNIFIKSLDASARMLVELRLQLDRPDVLIRPNVNHCQTLEEIDPAEIIDIGDHAAAVRLDDVHKAFSWRKRFSRRFRRNGSTGPAIPMPVRLDHSATSSTMET